MLLFTDSDFSAADASCFIEFCVLLDCFLVLRVQINNNNNNNKFAQSNLGRGPRRGAVAHVRRKVPIGYNGAPQIRPQKYPFLWTDPQTALTAPSLDPSDL